MYQIEGSRQLLSLRGARRRLAGARISRTVLLLGLVSMFTDVSSEMVATILPLYLVFSLGLSPVAFGVVDGLQQGAAAFVRIAGGFAGDRTRRYKEVAALGYGLSAISRLGMLVANTVASLSAVVIVERTGKGIRTAPRDALISLSTEPSKLGLAFGVHRALDTAGAMIGPLLAFLILSVTTSDFDSVFVLSFCFAVLGLAVLLFFVQNQPAPQGAAAPVEQATLRGAAGLVRVPRFRVLLLVAGALGLTTLSDGFLYLGLQRKLDFDPTLMPLLFVGTALAYMFLAVPMGRLADRVGRGWVFAGGYGLLLLAYGSLLLPATGGAELVVYLVLFGAYYAATDGVLMALASALLPPSLVGSGLGLLVTVTSFARLGASVVFGAIWSLAGFDVAISIFAAALLLTLPLATMLLVRSKEPAVA